MSLPILGTPTLLYVISGSGYVSGIACLASELYVVEHGSSQVNVYNNNNFSLTHNISISGSSSLGLYAIVASARYNSLFMSDTGLDIVFRYNLSNNVVTKLSVGGWCRGLSLTSIDNVLVTLSDTKQLKEYTPDGHLMRVISLDSSLEYPWHSAPLSGGDRFVVSHGYNEKQLQVLF